MTRAILVAFLFCTTSSFAQTPITFQYIYDEIGQLIKVVEIGSNGSMAFRLHAACRTFALSSGTASGCHQYFSRNARKCGTRRLQRIRAGNHGNHGRAGKIKYIHRDHR